MEKQGFEKIQGTARCACCNSFVSKQKMVQFPKMLLVMLKDAYELGLCPKCSDKKSVAELQSLLETKYERQMPTLKVQAQASKTGKKHWSKFQDGITNQEMIPMVKEALVNGDNEVILELSQLYPEVFESTQKYIGKKRRNKIEDILKQTELQEAM